MELREVTLGNCVIPQLSYDQLESLMYQTVLPTTNATVFNDGNGNFLTYEMCADELSCSVPPLSSPHVPQASQFALGPNGSLIPLLDSTSIPVINGNTYMILTTDEQEEVVEPVVPPHILDHMYAKKVKEPGSSTPAKPRRRVRKKPPVVPKEPVIPANIKPDVSVMDSAKVNIIRKNMHSTGGSLSSSAFQSSLFSRPKILQNSKRISSVSANELLNTNAKVVPNDRIKKEDSVEPVVEAPLTPSSTATHIYYSSSQHQPVSSTFSVPGNGNHRVQLATSSEADLFQSNLYVNDLGNQEMCFMLSTNNKLSPNDQIKTEAAVVHFPSSGIAEEQPSDRDILGEVAVFSVSAEDISFFPQTLQNTDETVNRTVIER